MLLLNMRVLSFIPTGLLCLFIFTATDVEGFASWCDINQTIFVPEESTAMFQPNFTDDYYRFRFYKYDFGRFQSIFYVYSLKYNITDDDIRYYDRSWENRTHVNGHLNPSSNTWDIRIEITNISMKDNGTYRLQLREHLCLILFVIQIRSEPKEAIEENKPVYLYAHPHNSVLTRPLTNASMVWLLDGLSVNKTASFIQQDGLIWIPHITRDLDGRNVSYRAIQDNGNVTEVNYTVNVKYGPSQPLTLIPGQTQYYFVKGDVMPDITCTVDCKPPCSVSWGKNSNSGILSLGAVTTDNRGEYTCIATRTGAKTVERTINIHVADNTSFTIAIACLAGVQALTTLGLGLCAFIIFRRIKQSPCQTCFNNSARKSPNQKPDYGSKSPAADNHGLEHYEELDTNTRQTKKVYEVPTEVGLETYENIRLSSISTPEIQVAHS